MTNGLDRVTFRPDIMGGQACIRDLRVPVSIIVNQIANGASFADIIADYNYLEEEDIRQALCFASQTASERIFII